MSHLHNNRRGQNALVVHGATRTSFRRWLCAAVDRARAEAVGPETAVFINAWNEWGEGTYPEPDRDFGRDWLETVASVVKPGEPVQTFVPVRSEDANDVRVRA